MVINEKALVNLMKKAYTKWGYTVSVGSNGRWAIHTPHWVVTIDGMGNVPNCVLSVIALHMGCFPQHNEAIKVFKGKNGPVLQNEIFAVAEEHVTELEKEVDDAEKDFEEIRRTSLRIGGHQVWQRLDDSRVFLIDPEHERLIAGKTDIRTVGEYICMEGNISMVFVRSVSEDRPAAFIAHLEQMQWVNAK